jgi:SEC-C motif-containing protein
MRATDTTACPCQSGRPYAGCCAPLHRHVAIAEDAEALMRSRYSAYALADRAYLLATWHAGTRPSRLDFDDALSTRWLGLEVKRHVVDDPDHATVEFIARYRTGGAPAVRLHEVSRFVREDGRWYYVDGEFPGR